MAVWKLQICWISYLVFALGGPGMFAQKVNVDSLILVTAQLKDSTARFNNYIALAHQLMHTDVKAAGAYADSAHTLAQVMQKPQWLSHVYTTKGAVAQKSSDLTLAMHWHEKALENAREFKNHELECLTLVNMAAVCVESGDNNRALELYREFKARVGDKPTPTLKATQITVQVGLGLVLKNQNKLTEAAQETKEGLDLAIRYQDKRRIWDFYDNLGLIYGRMGDYAGKCMYHRKALEAADPTNPYIAVVYNNLANGFLALNMLDSAAYYFMRAANDPKTRWKSLIHTYDGLSQVEFLRGRYAAALEWSGKAVPLAEKTGNAMTIVAAQTEQAKALMGLKRYDEAVRIFKDVITRMDANRDYAFVEERANAKKYLAQALALKEGKHDVAQMIDAYSRGRDSIHNFVVTQAVEELRIQYEARQKEDSIRILAAEQQLQSAKAARYQMGFFGGMLLAGLLGLLLFFIVRKRRLEKTVYEQQYQLLRHENQSLLARIQSLETTNGPRSLLDFADDTIVLNGSDKQVFRIGDILYFGSQGNGVQVVTLDGRHWRWQTMKNLESVLPNPPFIKVHRSFLVNGMHIRQYKASRFTLSDGSQIKVGVTLQPEADAFLRKWLPELA